VSNPWHAISLALVAIAAVSLPLTAEASQSPVATFSFSGSLTGRISMTNNGCEVVGGASGTFELSGKLHGISGTNDFILGYVDGHKNGGTFAINQDAGVSVSLDAASQKKGGGDTWTATSGTLTTKGGKGSMVAHLAPSTDPVIGKPGKGDVTVHGNWSCKKAGLFGI
jgi:hypothetical protein